MSNSNDFGEVVERSRNRYSEPLPRAVAEVRLNQFRNEYPKAFESLMGHIGLLMSEQSIKPVAMDALLELAKRSLSEQ